MLLLMHCACTATLHKDYRTGWETPPTSTPKLKLNTEIRKPLTIFGISVLRGMGTPKWRCETDWLLSSCARRTSRRRRRSSEQMGTTDARDLTTITTHIGTITDIWLDLVPCSLRGSCSKAQDSITWPGVPSTSRSTLLSGPTLNK
jgi:hypothetical protein